MTIVKRSVSISGHSTSISVEDRFWGGLQAIAARQNVTVARLITQIDAGRNPDGNLSSAIRLFVLEDALARADPAAIPPVE
ncbi:ribbon-helix-helix domain-containing protein [Jiella sp. MQZ9-1]|uniref:Ribbon-helix-helix domain-containing protein n=1 Tax=Jiella flava TaxID=2816857 RepID=A0A939JUA4_9HYPH|nr:ribbon-helix-helix domain-containing protein [Jiella flava]MCD2469864.1 ribbon-helix-helix domain-containing protein [Jiella flava]